MKKAIETQAAPAAIGPYSQAIRVGDLIYTSGQLPLDLVSGELVGGGIQEQTRQALTHIKSILEAAGSSLDQVVKTTVFLQDIGDFAAMNEIYAQFFAQPFPARSAFQVAALPRGAMVEIEAVAAAGN